MSKKSRTKGKTGEREIVLLAKEAGFDKACRNWHEASTGGQVNGDILGVLNYYIEVRRRERQDFPGWLREVKERAGSRPWMLVTRRNSEEWMTTIPLAHWFHLLSLIPPDQLAEAIQGEDV